MDLNFVLHQSHFPKTQREAPALEIPLANTSDDFQLWQEFKAGSESAFSKIYRLHATLLFSYGMKLVRDKELIKDCIQDLFVEIWNTRQRLGCVKNIKSYLFKAFRRKLIKEAVKNRKRINLHQNFFKFKPSSIPSEEWGLIAVQTHQEQQMRLKQAIKHLTTRQQEIINLKFFYRLSYPEIAETMDISMKGTYKLMGRTICFLRKYMAQPEII